ncbi:MAG: ABC transporter substrate-binding protein [Cyanobacteria bacterium J06632_22]
MMSSLFRCGSPILAAGLLTASCASLPEPETTTDVTQADTAPVNLPTAERIVALTSLSADIIHTLDQDRLVGMPGSSLLTEDTAFDDIETVSQGRSEPDLEKIVALEPDLVVGSAGFHDKALERIAELGVETLSIDVASWQDLSNVTETLAAYVEADPAPLLTRYEGCLAQAPETGPATLILASIQPLLAPNKNSWAGDFLNKFNRPNVAADLQGESPFEGYVTLSEEKLLEANPEQIIVIDTDENVGDRLAELPFWQEMQAVKSGEVYSFEYFGLINPGSIVNIEKTCEQMS